MDRNGATGLTRAAVPIGVLVAACAVLFSLVPALAPAGAAAYLGGTPAKHASARHHSDDSGDSDDSGGSGRTGRMRQNAGCGKVITSWSRIHEAWEQPSRDNRPVCVRMNNQTVRAGRRAAG